MRKVIIDSNVIVKWFIPEDYSEQAKLLRNDHLMGYVEATAPIYALLEVYSALRKYLIRGVINEKELNKITDLLYEVGIRFIGITKELLDKAIRYSIEKHVTIYDAYYIVLAYELDTVVYTADEKLLRRLSGDEPKVKHIKKYTRS